MKHLITLSLTLGLVFAAPAMAQTKANLSVTAPIKAAELAPVATRNFHENAGDNTVWSNSENFSSLIHALESLTAHGLNPEDYHLAALKAGTANDPSIDRLATDAWFSAAAHMLYGKLNPVTVEPDWTASRRKADLPGVLSAALETGKVAGSLEQFAPKQASYAALLLEYKNLRTEAATPITIVPAGPTLKSGMSGIRVSAMKKRLSELGLYEEAPSSDLFDADTLAAVKAFQNSAELDDDGVVGTATLTALNRGPENRINQVLVNLERWRWLPDDLGNKHLRANIAGFNVTAWEDGAAVRTYLTIVGKPFRKTPVFSDEVEYIVFNPWWETPYSLATKDKLPAFRKDPSAVQKLGFDVLDRSGQKVDSTLIDWNAVSASNFPYRLRQRPGDMNALGQVKIMFPNVHNVYLHDTPTRGLFASRQRAFSSGCMRTQYPLDLSEWLLKGSGDWDRAKIDAVVASGKETRADLARKVPVHVLYFTIVYEGYMGVRYLDDIYQRDPAVLAGLRSAPKSR